MDIRVASFNASLNRNNAGDLINDLSNGDNAQAQAVAEILQRTNADIVLINEFDFDAGGRAAALFQQNYLSVSQNGQAPIDYPHVYVAPSNTGVPSGFDLDNSGAAGDFAPNDAQGFGFFEGQFGFVILSRHPIDEDNIRTFQNFLWADMPGALLPADPLDSDGDGDLTSFYSAEELDVLRLSSKNHVDVPVIVNGETVHILAAHPTPPVFDGPEDRNGTRNHDEIRFWADYVAGEGYIYDDNGVTGGLAAGERFVIVGDYNADPFDGDSVLGAAQQIIDSPFVQGSTTDANLIPSSEGGVEASANQGGANDGHTGNPAFDTADFGFAGAGNPDAAPGNLRVDYALPSQAGFVYLDGGVFWQTPTDPLFPLAEFPTSDHRLVYADLRIVDGEETSISRVSAGDVTEDSIVLLANTAVTGDVTFDLFAVRDDGSRFQVMSQTVAATDPAAPVKATFEGLDAGTDYVYVVTDAGGAMDEGHFTTAHEDGFNGLSFGVTGDWRGELAPYPAIANAIGANLDWFLLGGDTIYADYLSPGLPGVSQAVTYEDFLAKYAEVYGSHDGVNFWADLFASTAIYATIDDHEVTNDFAGGSQIGTTAEDEFRDLFPTDDPTAFVNDATLFENGLQAFFDSHAIAETRYGETGDDRTAHELQLYRSQQFGQDAAVMILDQRSFRDEQVASAIGATDPAVIQQFVTESFDPTRTMLGDVQLDQLLADLLEAEANGVTWKFIYSPEPFQELGFGNSDSWEGYRAERNAILQFIDENDIDNVVFVAADIHATFVNNLTYSTSVAGELTGQQIATNAFEITTGSVAFDAPFGPSIAEGAAALGVLSPEEYAFYLSLPVAPDNDSIPNDRDDFITSVFNSVTLGPLGRDPLGLDNNLPQADGLIDATLLQGGWVSAHTFGWTQFDIDAETQALTVTTYGIPSYGEAEAGTNLDAVPQIVSQFVVNPVIDAVVTDPGTPGADSVDGGDAADMLSGRAGNDTLDGGAGNDTLTGNVGFDSLVGGAGADMLFGNSGLDTLEGGAGNDTLEGGFGADLLLGGVGDDNLSGGVGFDTLEGGHGDDSLSGSAGYDMLTGGDGNDTIHGNSGRDTIAGGAGDDLLHGGIGADVFIYASGDGADVILDFQNNQDTIQIDAALLAEAAPVAEDLRTYATRDANGFVVLDFGNGDTLTFVNTFTTTAILDDVVFV